MSGPTTKIFEALARAEDAMTEQALLHRVSDSGFDTTSNNLLAHHSPEHLAFSPGLRTRDNGQLGDTSGFIDLDLDLQPPSNETYQWELVKNGKVLAKVDANDKVGVVASKGGRYSILLRNKASKDIVGGCSVSVPQFAFVQAELQEMSSSLEELGIPDTEKPDVWNAILEKAKTVAHHILRPANFRLIWPGDETPQYFEAHEPGTEALLSPTQSYTFENESTGQQERIFAKIPCIIVGAPDQVVASTRDTLSAIGRYLKRTPMWAGASLLSMMMSETLGMMLPEIETGSREMPEPIMDEPEWFFDACLSSFRLGVLRLGLGSMSFSGDKLQGDEGSPVDRVLRILAGAVRQNEWQDSDAATRKRFVEIAGRLVGVSVARAMLRLHRVPIEGHEHLSEADNAEEVVAGSLLAVAPANPLQDLLGLWRPETDGNAREMDELLGDLNAQYNSAEDPASAWVDLVKLESEDFRTARHLTGQAGVYDVLAGVVSEDALDYLDASLGLLPPTYGPYAFRAGDRDNAINNTDQDIPVYGGENQPDGPADDLIALMQSDLKAVGINVGLEDSGFYSYLRWETGTEKYDGEAAAAPTPTRNRRNNRTALKKGNTAWAVREFQIACRYPNTVAERLDAEPHYANRLRIVGRSGSPKMTNQPASSALSDWVNGSLSIPDANRLRRWRFSRRRYPIVIIAGSNNEKYGVAGSQTPVENLMQTDEVTTTAARMRVIDYSGYFGADETAAVLGYYSIDNWRGPANEEDEHPQCDLTPTNALGVPQAEWEPSDEQDGETPAEMQERERRERFLSAFRVIAAIGQEEAIGHFDGLNAYDGAIFSYPLFHHTLTLQDDNYDDTDNKEARPGQMALFIRWLRNPEDTFLEEVFPDAGIQNPPDVPSPYPQTQDGVDSLRRQLKDKMQSIYQGVFGFFGVGASEKGQRASDTGFTTVSGLETGVLPDGSAIDMRNHWDDMPSGNDMNPPRERLRHQAFYQAYQQWFRTWQWFYRFAAPLRESQDLRTLLFAYEMDWVNNKLDGVWNDIQTERGRAVYIRIAVRSSKHFGVVKARDAVREARENAADGEEIDEAEAMRDEINDERLRNSTRRAMNYNSDDAIDGVGVLEDEESQSDTIYTEVRNDLLRRLIVEED